MFELLLNDGFTPEAGMVESVWDLIFIYFTLYTYIKYLKKNTYTSLLWPPCLFEFGLFSYLLTLLQLQTY